MNLVITDSGLGGLSICAQLMRLIKERAMSTLPQLPVDDLHITYVNAVPADERGYNFMSGRAEQLETFEKILLNTDKLFAPDYVFVACGTLSVLLEKLLYPSDKAIKIEGIVTVGIKMLLESLGQNSQPTALIFATPITISANTFQNMLCQNGIAENRIIAQNCPNLATQISNDPEGELVEKHIRHWVQKALQQLPENIKSPLIAFLGCTHYGYRENLFKEAFNAEGYRNVTLLNPNYAAAEKLNKIVLNNGKSNPTKAKSISINFVTPYAIPERENITIPQLLHPISAETADAFLNARVCPELLNH